MNDPSQPWVYLSWTRVFLMDALLVGQRKRLVCAQHGLVGVIPDDYTNPEPKEILPDQGYDISRTEDDPCMASLIATKSAVKTLVRRGIANS